MGKLYRDLVRTHSKAKGSARALLNILADYATDEGLAWPTRATLANDTGMSERTVTRALQTLCDDGRLALVDNVTGGRGRVPHYRIVFPAHEKGDNVSPKRETGCHPLDAKRVTNGHIKGDNVTVKGDKFAGILSHARSEPQEPKEEPEGERARATVPSLREPASKTMRVTSPHLDPRHFVQGFVPQGTGANPVEVYYERFSINQDAARLNAIAEDDITRLCPDLDKLREVIVAYSRTPFRPGNMQLILDWYRDGIPEKHRGAPANGLPKTISLSDAEKSKIVTRARNAQGNIKTAQQFKGNIDPAWQEAIDTAKGFGLI